MRAGRLKAQIVLCAIGIFDLPYIFGNFAPQFPEKHRRNPRRWADSLQLYRRRVKVRRKLKTNIIYLEQRLSFGTGFAALLVDTQTAHALCKIKRAQ